VTRPSRPVPVAVVRSIAGAGLSVLGVSLGIVVLHWTSGAPLGSLVVVDQVAAAPQDAAPPAPAAVAATPSPSAAPGASHSLSAVPSASASAPGTSGSADVLAAPPAAVPLPSTGIPSPLAPSSTPGPTPVASPVMPITVLNNSRRTRLAAQAAARFEAGGWPVVLTGNFRGRIPVTTVYYDPGLEDSARAFAGSFDGIVRVRPRFATLPARGLVVVVTREFAA
jgi:hypothetical protein